MKSFFSFNKFNDTWWFESLINVLTLLVPIWSAPQRRPDPPPFMSRSDLILFGHIHNLLQWNVLIENNNFAHIGVEHVVICTCILEKCIQENTEKRVSIFLINRAFAVKELTWLLRDIHVYNKKFLCLFIWQGTNALPTRNLE